MCVLVIKKDVVITDLMHRLLWLDTKDNGGKGRGITLK
jgi:hypothetical protein